MGFSNHNRWKGRDRGAWARRTWRNVRRNNGGGWTWGEGGVSKGRPWWGKKGTGVDAVCQRKKKREGRVCAMRESCLWERFGSYSEGLRAG